MADEVYEGAIGIDLGTTPCDSDEPAEFRVTLIVPNFVQAPHTHV